MKKLTQVIIHVGTDKAGSTYLQRVLFDNRAGLERLGVLYSCGVSHNDAALSRYFSDSDEKANLYFPTGTWFKRESYQSYVDSIEEAVKQTDADTLVLSHEGLMQLDLSELRGLKDFVSRFSDAVLVVLYARSMQSYAVSAMCQLVKTGRSVPQFTAPYIPYKNIIPKLEKVFGPQSLIVRKFEPRSFFGEDMIADFFSLFDNAIHGDNFKALDKSGDKNQKFSRMGLLVGDKIIRLLGDSRFSRPYFKRKIGPHLYDLSGGSIVLSRAQNAFLSLHAFAHIKYLSEEFGIDFGSHSNNSDVFLASKLDIDKHVFRILAEEDMLKDASFWARSFFIVFLRVRIMLSSVFVRYKRG